jgi:4a-hydroxytetrahydrobiopterin dehydratase
MKHLKSYKIFESQSSDWSEINGKLQKQFQFKDFAESLDFVNKIAEVCEKENHHPEINWIYNKVIFNLSTHDAGDVVTEKDINLSKLIDYTYNEIFKKV